MPEKTNPTIYQELARIQKELRAPKGQWNSFSKFNYRSCEDIVEAVKPLLGDLSLLLSDEIVLVGSRYYVKATVRITDGKQVVEAFAMAREAEDKKGMDEAQVTGAASSYARKYALNGLFAIDDTKDADTEGNSRGMPPAAETRTTTNPLLKTKRKEFFAVCNEKGLDAETEKEGLKQRFGAASFNDISLKDLSAAVYEMRNKIPHTVKVGKAMSHELAVFYVGKMKECGTVAELEKVAGELKTFLIDDETKGVLLDAYGEQKRELETSDTFNNEI